MNWNVIATWTHPLGNKSQLNFALTSSPTSLRTLVVKLGNVQRHGRTTVASKTSSVSSTNVTSRDVVMLTARFCRSAIFLLHIALEIPVAVQGLLSPSSLPFLQLNNTTLVILKVRCDSLLVRATLSALTRCRCSCTPHWSQARVPPRSYATVFPVRSLLRLHTPLNKLTVTPRVLTWQARPRDRTMHLPPHMFHDPLQRATYHPNVIRCHGRTVRVHFTDENFTHS